jgi:tRNA threonylcarbamoyladenosine biosynthesis protein TsaB
MRLGIDTTNNNLCFALLDDNACHRVLHAENIYPCSNAAEILAPKIADMLHYNAMNGSHITKIISVTGPGGFSGVRIGTAFVTGFTANSTIQVIGLSSLEALALSVIYPQENSIIIACLNARREGVYIGIFNHHYHRLTPDSVIDTHDLESFLAEFQTYSYYIAGHGFDIVKPFLNPDLLLDTLLYPLAQEFTAKAEYMVSHHNNEPIYLRPPDAKLPQKKI